MEEAPAEWIPRCPECDWKMLPWVQNNTVLQGEAWQVAYQRYEDFVKKYHNKKLLLLELGVGDMTKTSAPEQLKGKNCIIVIWELCPHGLE